MCRKEKKAQRAEARRAAVLVEAVAALSDHGVCVRKCYISSDDGLRFIGRRATTPAKERRLCVLELVGDDRPGLQSEVFAVLHDLRCGTVDARAWTHGGRVAALVFVREEDTGAPIHEPSRIRRIESRLRHVLRGGARGVRTVLVDAAAVRNLDRRLHQLLNEDVEPGRRAPAEEPASIAAVSCRDRPKLLFTVHQEEVGH
ncbi:ACT domain-containing protein ACR8-like [Lolium perenne]|uniref:ACT domain-containing protein ACR8-like n=1 Tax=Lolium perenne TaxID=4522 RepID=UPI0021F5116B|nr:ACT domain-containing protein ACR8-like [Lolium perenne]